MLLCFHLEADCDMFALNHFWAFLSVLFSNGHFLIKGCEIELTIPKPCEKCNESLMR